MELNYILDSLKDHNLEPALTWVSQHHESLEKQNSSLEFKLHRLHFVNLLQKGESAQTEAINYARTHFYKFVRRHEKGNLVLKYLNMFFLTNTVNLHSQIVLIVNKTWKLIISHYIECVKSILKIIQTQLYYIYYIIVLYYVMKNFFKP